MLKILGIILAVITISISGYGLITDDHSFTPLMITSLGALMLIRSIEDYKEGNKLYAYFNIGVTGFMIFVLIQIFFYG
ncbi:hypothetical protein ACOJQI_10815 [Bacillus salacetis]|uniref:hypothetical protein n=1 Tax=Bacillus salacetis TaxID=2315464 RepID=UPI003BA37421